MARGSTVVKFILSVALIGTLIGLRVWLRSNRTANTGNENVSMVEKDDPEMNGAIAKSHQTVQQFIDHLSKPGPGETGFSVKVPVKEGGTIEHFWLSGTTCDGISFRGRIGDAPYMLKRVKEGDAWTCRVDEISDWMYLKNGRLVGGESIRVLRNKMSASERAKFDASAPFKID